MSNNRGAMIFIRTNDPKNENDLYTINIKRNPINAFDYNNEVLMKISEHLD